MIDRLMCDLRRTGFFLLDQIQGGIVKKNYEKMKLLEGFDWNSKEVTEHQNFALKELLKHSIDSVVFYSHIRRASLADFPVINKEIIRIQQDNFISSNFSKDKLYTIHTSGSTGTPFVCYQNKNKKKHVNAELIFFSEKVGYKLGRNLIFFRAVPINFKKSKLKQWIQNESIIDITKLDDDNIEKILKRISQSKHYESMVLGYSSTYSGFKEYFDRKGTSIVSNASTNGFVGFADMLFDDTRKSIEKAFNCRCYSRYSNQENGIIGQDDTENNVFILNEAHYIVEILKMDEDESAETGEVGRIVITDLYNKAMPMIRYDTGDIGSIKFLKVNGVLKRAINNFGGRRLDIVFDSYGTPLSPHFITNYFFQFSEIKQFQFIQETSSKYTVKVNIRSNFEKLEEIKSFLKEKLGTHSHITIEVVDEVPVLSSGKRKYIVNLME